MIGLGTIRGRMRRRLLLTYRIEPEVAAGIIPAPFRPQLVDGSAVGGVCMISLTEMRPGWIRPRLGVRTENVAHRFAVEWDDGDRTRTGVYITERHSSSVLPVLGGGRVFPGVQSRARFDVAEGDDRYRIRMDAGDVRVVADVELTEAWNSSLFPTVEAASDFYRSGAVGWSPGRGGRAAEALQLTSSRWAVAPVRVDAASSSFFDGLPAGSAALDSALVMLDIPVVWRRPEAARP